MDPLAPVTGLILRFRMGRPLVDMAEDGKSTGKKCPRSGSLLGVEGRGEGGWALGQVGGLEMIRPWGSRLSPPG